MFAEFLTFDLFRKWENDQMLMTLLTKPDKNVKNRTLFKTLSFPKNPEEKFIFEEKTLR